MEPYQSGDDNGVLWEEGEFDRGTLVQFSIKDGKPFDGNRVIDITDSEDTSMIDLLLISRPDTFPTQISIANSLILLRRVRTFNPSFLAA